MKKRIVRRILAVTLIGTMLSASGCGREAVTAPEEIQENVETSPTEEEPVEDSGPVEEITDEVVDEPVEEEPELDSEVPILQIVTDWDSTETADGQYMTSTISVDRISVLSDGYDTLKESFAAYKDEEIEPFKESVVEFAGEEPYDDFTLATWPWTYCNSVHIERCDTDILSYIRTISSYLGGAHPFTYYVAENLNTQTGEALELVDVFTSEDEFKTVLFDRMENHEYSSEFYPDWKESLENYFSNPQEYSLVWYLTDSGVSVIFSAYEMSYYALGAVMVDIPYADYPELFNPEVVPEEKAYCKHMGDYGERGLETRIDLDNDGEEEVIFCGLDVEYSEEYDYIESATPTVGIVKGKETVSIVLDAALDVGNEYIIQGPDGHYYMYIEYMEENDWQALRIIDVTDPIEGPKDLGFNESGAFYDFQPLAADRLCVQTRLYVMGTRSAYRVCQVGKDGQLIPYDEEYRLLSYTGNLDDIALVTISEFKAYQYESREQKDKRVYVTIPVESKIIPYSTDGDTYMTVLLEDGTYADIVYDEDCESWDRTIGGVSELDLIEGIVYAG